jgi:hypothetical protein
LTAATGETFLCTGRVVRDDATPVVGALAAVGWGTAPTPEIAIRTDADGQFRVALPNGRFRLDARAPDGATGSTELSIANAARAFQIVVRPR